MLTDKNVKIWDYTIDIDNPCWVIFNIDSDELEPDVDVYNDMRMFLSINPFSGKVRVDVEIEQDGKYSFEECLLTASEERALYGIAEKFIENSDGLSIKNKCENCIKAYERECVEHGSEVIDQRFVDDCNRAFNVKIARIDFPYVFDVYDTKESAEENIGESPLVLEKSGTLKEVDGVYVFINEVNASEYYVGISFDEC